MSCPAKNAPLAERLAAIDGDAELPASFYWLTLGMVLLVCTLPLIYRWTWVFLWDIISGVRQDLAPPKRPEGCRRVGKQANRNLSEESFTTDYQRAPRHESFPQPSASDLENSMSKEFKNTGLEGRIEGLFIHPIKSTAPIEVESATITPLGLNHDRIFSFAQLESKLPDLDGRTEHTWTFLTQREAARLALVKTELWLPDSSAEDHDDDHEWVGNGGCLIVRFPFVEDVEFSRQGIRNIISQFLLRIRSRGKMRGRLYEFRIPLEPCKERIKTKEYRLTKMRIFKEYPEAWDVGCEVEPEVLAKLAYTLGISNPFTLFRIPEKSDRDLYKCAPTSEQIGYQSKVALQDAYPISLQNLGSIEQVEKKVTELAAEKGKHYRPDSRRFRANMYISGPTAFSELHLKRMAIQARHVDDDDQEAAAPPAPLLFSLPCRIPRCQIPNNDPLLGQKDLDVFQPLTYLNKTWKIDAGAKSGILGMMAVPLQESIGRVIRVGDEIVLYNHGEHMYNKLPEKEHGTPNW